MTIAKRLFACNIHKGRLFLSSLLLSLLAIECSVQSLAVRATAGIIDNTINALYRESEYDLAFASMGGFLKQLDGLILTDPGNKKLLLNAIEGYTGYALGFIEDNNKESATTFYLRAKDYGFQLLSKDASMKKGLEGNWEDLKAALKTQNKDDVPALFWTANAWAGYINLNRRVPDALAGQEKVDMIMQRVLELDENFFFASAHMYFGIIYGERGIAGGDLKKSREHFERSFELSDKKFLLSYVMYARYYAANDLDEEEFDRALNHVFDTPVDILPDYALLNAIAKRKAKLLMDNKDEYF